MKPRHSDQVRNLTPVASTGSEVAPHLPAWKAFVVQLSRDSGVKRGVFEGRIEHLNSGRRLRFESKKSLLASLQVMLDEIEGTSK